MEISKIKSYIFKNLLTGSIKTILSSIIAVISIPIIISKIGIGNYGIISIVLIFSSFTGMVDLGLSKGLIYFHNDKTNNDNEISAIYFINICLFLVFLLLGGVIYVLDLNLLGKNLDIEPTVLRWINCISIITLSFGVINNLLRASLEAKFKLPIVNWGFLIQAFIINIGWLVLAIYNANIFFFIFVPLISTIITISYHSFFLPSIFTLLKKPELKSIKNVFNITLQFFKVGALNSMHLPIIKFLFIYLSGDQRAIGIFEVSTKLALLTKTLLSYVSNPFFSIVSNYKEKNSIFLLTKIKEVTKLLIIVALLGYTIFIILNDFLISYFFNEYTSEIFKVLNITLIGYLFIAASEGVQKYFLGLGRINLVANVKFSTIILNLVIILILYSFDYFNIVSMTFAYSISLVFFGLFFLIKIFQKNNTLNTK